MIKSQISDSYSSLEGKKRTCKNRLLVKCIDLGGDQALFFPLTYRTKEMSSLSSWSGPLWGRGGNTLLIIGISICRPLRWSSNIPGSLWSFLSFKLPKGIFLIAREKWHLYREVRLSSQETIHSFIIVLVSLLQWLSAYLLDPQSSGGIQELAISNNTL